MLKLNKEIYNDRIKVYYNNRFDKDLIQEVVKCIKCDNNTNSDIKLVKEDKGRQVFKLAVNNKKYYIKKYFYRKTSKRLKNLFRSAEALRAFEISNRLLRAGIPVVQPVLAVVYRCDFWTFDSIYVSEDFQGINLQNYLAFGNDNEVVKRQVIKEVARLWAKVYKKRFINGDPNLASILIKFTGDNFKLSLVDVDNTRHVLVLPESTIIKNLIEFNAHSYSGLDRIGKKKLSFEDRILFLKEFILSSGRKVNLTKITEYIGRKTAYRLLEWGKEYLVSSDESLSVFYRRN